MFGKTKKNKKDTEVLPDCLARTYGVEIFVDKEPTIATDELLIKLRKLCGNVELIADNDKLILFAFKDYMVKYSVSGNVNMRFH